MKANNLTKIVDDSAEFCQTRFKEMVAFVIHI